MDIKDQKKYANDKKKYLSQLIKDTSRPIGLTDSHKVWMALLGALLAACLFAYTLQLRRGLIVTGMRDYISWGIYISNFVFFVACSLVGMFISAVLGLAGAKWVTPITRLAEIIAVAFAMVAGLVIISDMGRPERFLYLFLYGRLHSPILWDVTVVTTYVIISLCLFYIPMIPDMAIFSKAKTFKPPFLNKIYSTLALKWKGTPKQIMLLKKAVRTLLILIIPVALAIHTVTSWLFAATPRTGWDSTIFGPYFVTGAFVAGTAALVIAMYFFRKNYKLQNHITKDHFNKIGKIMVLISLVYLYFNINEFLVPAYKMKLHDATHIHELFVGKYALMFWSVQLGGLIIPLILMLFKRFRKPLPMLIMSIFILIGSWFKRYLIVIPTQEHPYLPIQNVPENYHFYMPTLIEAAVSMAAIIMVIMIISLLAKFFPLLPVWEMAHEKGIENPEELAAEIANEEFNTKEPSN